MPIPESESGAHGKPLRATTAEAPVAGSEPPQEASALLVACAALGLLAAAGALPLYEATAGRLLAGVALGAAAILALLAPQALWAAPAGEAPRAGRMRAAAALAALAFFGCAALGAAPLAWPLALLLGWRLLAMGTKAAPGAALGTLERLTLGVLLSVGLERSFEPGLWRAALESGLQTALGEPEGSEPVPALLGLGLWPALLWVALPAGSPRRALLGLLPGLLGLGLGWIRGEPWLTIAGLIAAAVLVARGGPQAATAGGIRAWLPAGAAAAAALLCLSSAPRAGAPEARPKIGIVAARHGSFEPLPRPWIAARRADELPRFGEFRRLLERAGAVVVDLEQPAALADPELSACITINLNGPEAAGFIEPARSFGARGGRLLVLADHTDLFGQIEPTNALLRETGIEVCFDSAVPLGLGGSWVGSLEAGRDGLFGPHRDGRGLSWGVGASLAVSRPGRVLARGTRAFLDAGDRGRPGGLGNLQLDAGERRGGFPIAAWGTLGSGRVLVLGDTSAVQTSALIDGRGFAARLAAWLLRGGDLTGGAAANGSLAAALAGICLLAALGARGSGSGPLWAAAVLAGAELWSERAAARAFLLEEPETQRVALLASAGAVGATRDEERLGALTEAFATLDHSLYAHPDAAAPRGAAAAVLLDPWRPVDPRVQERWLDFVERGGRLLAFVGRRGAGNLAPLLAALEVRLGMPLGRGFESAYGGPLASVPGVPTFGSSFALEGPGLSSATVLATCFGRPVAARFEHGRGSIVLVADSEVFVDRCIEPSQGGTQAAALTLHRLLATFLGEAPQ